MTDIDKLDPALQSEVDALVANYNTQLDEKEKRLREINPAYMKKAQESEMKMKGRLREISDIELGADLDIVTTETVDGAPIKARCQWLDFGTDGVVGRDEDLKLSLRANLLVLTKDGNVSKNSHKLDISKILSINDRPCTDGFRNGTETLQKEILDEYISGLESLINEKEAIDKQIDALYENLTTGLRALRDRLPLRAGRRYDATIQECSSCGISGVLRKEPRKVQLLCTEAKLQFSDNAGAYPYYTFSVYGKRFLTDETMATETKGDSWYKYIEILNIEEI